MIGFIDDHREAYGVEPICRVLPIAPSTYRAHVAKRGDPSKLSTRARRDLALKPEIARVFEENFEVYGVRKVWRQLQREGVDIARCTVARLMRSMGLQGVIRGKRVRTTIGDKAAPSTLEARGTALLAQVVVNFLQVPLLKPIQRRGTGRRPRRTMRRILAAGLHRGNTGPKHNVHGSGKFLHGGGVFKACILN